MDVAIQRQPFASREAKRVGQRYESLATDTLTIRLAATGVDANARHAEVECGIRVLRDMLEVRSVEIEVIKRERWAREYESSTVLDRRLIG